MGKTYVERVGEKRAKIWIEKQRLARLGQHYPKISLALKGRIISKKQRKQISKANKGKHRSPKTEFKKGYKPSWGNWSKGLTKETDERVKKVSEGMIELWKNPQYRKKIKLAKLGKHYPKMSLVRKGKHYSPKTEFKKGNKHPDWLEGKSLELYNYNFGKKREKIKKRDNYTCQECNQRMLGKNKLDVHHIDYNKKNDKSSNLITLCKSCHSKIKNNFKYCTKHFKNK